MRLIDETAYQDKLAKIPMGERFFVKAVETAQHMPTIDAVEVVRCKDCKNDGTVECVRAHIVGGEIFYCEANPDFYCGYGEKKEETE